MREHQAEGEDQASESQRASQQPGKSARQRD
jgi:hypothetical protein